MAKNYCPDSLHYVVCKFLEKLVIIDLLITLRIVAFLSDFQYVSGLLDQL